MRITKFRVRNYKSIQDSGDCYPSESVSIFAGKNESGKTSILEALEDFNFDRDVRPKAKPIDNPDAIPSIEVTFAAAKSEIVSIYTDLGISVDLPPLAVPVIRQEVRLQG